MSAQKDCEFLVKKARELVSVDSCAAKAWLITARTLYPTDFNIQVLFFKEKKICLYSMTAVLLLIYLKIRPNVFTV